MLASPAIPPHAAAPMRPKVGKLPPLPSSIAPLPPAPASLESASASSSHWDGRFLVYSFALIAVLALIVALMLRNAPPKEHDSSLPSAAPDASIPAPAQAIALTTPTSTLNGQIESVAAPKEALPSYSPTQTPVDKSDRERLLSIISNN